MKKRNSEKAAARKNRERDMCVHARYRYMRARTCVRYVGTHTDGGIGAGKKY